MNRLILHMIVSVDGFISDGEGGVNPRAQWDEETQRFYLDTFGEAGGVIFGRGIYEAYVGHWRKVANGTVAPQNPVEREWAERLIGMPKYVVSSTLETAPDNTTVLGGDIEGEVATLKRAGEANLLLICGASLYAQLTRARLIDEYMFFTCPYVMARGDRLFRELPEGLELSYEGLVPFSSGMNLVRYRPVYPS